MLYDGARRFVYAAVPGTPSPVQKTKAKPPRMRVPYDERMLPQAHDAMKGGTIQRHTDMECK